jgi:hypothetical protein
MQIKAFGFENTANMHPAFYEVGENVGPQSRMQGWCNQWSVYVALALKKVCVVGAKMRQVRIELTTLGLWDLRAANCATAAMLKSLVNRYNGDLVKLAAYVFFHTGIHISYDGCGVRTHALADWRLKPAP